MRCNRAHSLASGSGGSENTGGSKKSGGNQGGNQNNKGGGTKQGLSQNSSNNTTQSLSFSKPLDMNCPKNNLLLGKLDKSGKLTAAERDRRTKNNLCLFCGEKGHKIADCNKQKQLESTHTNTATTNLSTEDKALTEVSETKKWSAILKP